MNFNNLIFIILLLNCSLAKNVFVDAYRDNKQTEQIYGSWGMCKTQVDEDAFIVANVCKTVVFDNNGGGKLLLGNNILSNFKWKIDTEKLQFTFNTPTDRDGFLDTATEYSFKLYTKADFKYLEIKPRDRETTYFLSRLKSGK